MTEEPRKGDLRELKSKTISWGYMPSVPSWKLTNSTFVRKTVSIYPRSGKGPKSRRLVVVWAARSYLVSPRVRLRSSLFPWTTFKTAKLLTSVDFKLPHPGL